MRENLGIMSIRSKMESMVFSTCINKYIYIFFALLKKLCRFCETIQISASFIKKRKKKISYMYLFIHASCNAIDSIFIGGLPNLTSDIHNPRIFSLNPMITCPITDIAIDVFFPAEPL